MRVSILRRPALTRRRGLIVVICLAAVAAACSEGTPAPNPTGPCQTDADCASGLFCLGGHCVEPGTFSDAGVDGGARDGGLLADGGSDGGALVDGGEVDGGGDAGLADGGVDGGPDGGGGLPLGSRCSSHGDCASQICLQLPSGAICTRTCRNDCPQDSVCKAYVLDGNRVVNLCVPFSSVYCVGCGASSECPLAGDVCTDVGGATYCTRDCSADGACPAGYDCKDVAFADTAEGHAATDGGPGPDAGTTMLRQCLPHSGLCPGCIDRDGDGYGVGAGCLGPDCDDHDRNVHPGATEICDGRDNNCDGQIDEGFDLQGDRNNCGGCGVVCNAGPDDQCCAGHCVRTASSTVSCGACGHPCAEGEVCCTGSCKDPQADPANCGGCNVACTNDHGGVACSSSLCVPSCDDGFGDCDSNPRNGCETSLTTIDHCGRCNVACANAHGDTRCVLGACVPTCQGSFGDCDANPANGCETPLLTTTTHCGACGQACVNEHGTTSCSDGLCRPICGDGFGDCDGNPRNGCETNTLASTANCGACGQACTNANGSTRCEGGQCKPTCSPGYADCNGNPRDGCETALVAVEVCGTCATDPDCPGGFYCAAGVCTKKHPRGAACADARECASGFCTDGVCCDGGCVGTCRSCKLLGSVGTCTLVAAGQDPEDECLADPQSSCGQDGTCDGLGACRLYGAGTVCQAQSCADSVQSNTRLCDGVGHCLVPMPPTQPCSPYVCAADGSACLSHCSIDADCGPDYACTGGACKLRPGLTCQSGADCASGFCTDGVCCNVACDGLCEACNLPGSVGRCDPIPAGADPDNECDAQAQSTCGRTGACSGTRGLCQLYPQGTICQAQSCVGGVESETKTCDGSGTCLTPTPPTVACSPYACDPTGTSCNTACQVDTDCAPLFMCAGTTCKLRQGQTCSADVDCASGFCTGGVCCESRCGGSCETCNALGRRGFCDALPSPPNTTCGSALSLGTLRTGDGLNTGVTSIAVEGESHWFVATFPMSTMTFGGGNARVQLIRNDGDQFRVQVVGMCSGPALACTTGTATALTDWSFTDDQSLAGTNQWTTRDVPWPTEIYFSVSRTTTGRSCDAYQVRISR